MVPQELFENKVPAFVSARRMVARQVRLEGRPSFAPIAGDKAGIRLTVTLTAESVVADDCDQHVGISGCGIKVPDAVEAFVGKFNQYILKHKTYTSNVIHCERVFQAFANIAVSVGSLAG